MKYKNALLVVLRFQENRQTTDLNGIQKLQTGNGVCFVYEYILMFKRISLASLF